MRRANICNMPIRKLLCILVFHAFINSLSVGAENPAESVELLERTFKSADIRSSGTSSYRLSAKLQMWREGKVLNEGKYLLFGDPSGKWREEIVFSGYTRFRIGNEHNYWQVRSVDFEPLPILEIDEFLDFPRTLKTAEKVSLSSPFKRKSSGIEYRCVDAQVEFSHKQTFCIDPQSGNLTSISNDFKGFETPDRVTYVQYSNFRKVADRIFPGKIEGFRGKKLILEIEFDEMKELPQNSPEDFTPPQNAARWLYCSVPASSKVDLHPHPEYPKSARDSRTQGMVTLYVVIDENGKTSSPHVLQSAGNALDEATIQAVSQWRYNQPICGDVKAPVETTVSALFTLMQ